MGSHGRAGVEHLRPDQGSRHRWGWLRQGRGRSEEAVSDREDRSVRTHQATRQEEGRSEVHMGGAQRQGGRDARPTRRPVLRCVLARLQARSSRTATVWTSTSLSTT